GSSRTCATRCTRRAAPSMRSRPAPWSRSPTGRGGSRSRPPGRTPQSRPRCFPRSSAPPARPTAGPPRPPPWTHRAPPRSPTPPPSDRRSRHADRRPPQALSLATRRSPSVADAALASARRLVDSMPRMLSALGRGKVTAQVAYATATATAPLDALQRRQVDEMLHERMPRMDGAGVKAWRAEVADAAGELDPDGAARRHLAARKNRHVTFTPAEHGMATVSAHLPALDAKLAHKRL